ncbi:Leucine-rich repeat-containing protein 2 [Hondaea fermentalgiana]|uniref:Leucine-rich repeat-containing protein 2 n=1 Tax=Hondaea fermentalgiana TaxID=2315210 RepID=A0A2R5GNE3_9STRA|nr:Leucine-rich repeat-containing protein 2 [Hondaea fermentalgiana]|eukprot:GBG32400.1 Leucine-rich repeat-containing protein 2 [Hondaea fermentalgiana]
MLTFLPDSISGLSELTYLDSYSNQLTSLPESISRLSELTTLRISDTDLTKLPQALRRMTSLTELPYEGSGKFDSCGSTAEPTEIDDCLCDDTACDPDDVPSDTLRLECIGQPAFPSSLPSSLTALDFIDSELFDLPGDTLLTLENLVSLNVSGNKLISIPAALASLPSLTSLNVKENSLCGSDALPDFDPAVEIEADDPIYAECTISLTFCHCTDCCEAELFEFPNSSSFVFETLADADRLGPDENGELWDKIVVDDLADVDLTHMRFVPVNADTYASFAALNCTQSIAVLRSRSEAIEPKLITLTAADDDSAGCIVNLNETFQNADEYQVDDLEFVYFLKDLSMASDSVQVYPYPVHILTIDERDQPYFLVDVFYTADDTEATDGYYTYVELRRNTFTSESCPYPPTVTLKLGDASDAACTKTLSVSETFKYNASIPLAELGQRLNTCVTDPNKLSESGSEIVYHVELFLSLTLPAECDLDIDTKPSLADDQATIDFYARLDNGVEPTSNVNQLVMKIADYSFEPCGDRVVAMGKTKYTIRLVTSIEPTEMTILANPTMGDVLLEPGDFSCTDETAINGTYECIVELTSTECLPMAREVSAETTSCSFDYLSALDVQATFTYADFAETGSLKDPTIVNDKVFTSDCPVPAAQTDVTGTYPVDLTIDGANLNNPITATIAFSNIPPTGSVTLRVVNVEVSMANGLYRRNFAVEDKVDGMQLVQTPWYEDGHFCRFEAAGSSDNTCAPFYAENSNAFTIANDAIFAVDDKGHQGCQSISTRNVDSFIFTPNEWVFGEFTETTSTMEITVTAVVDTCSTPSWTELPVVPLALFVGPMAGAFVAVSDFAAVGIRRRRHAAMTEAGENAKDAVVASA